MTTATALSAKSLWGCLMSGVGSMGCKRCRLSQSAALPRSRPCRCMASCTSRAHCWMSPNNLPRLERSASIRPSRSWDKQPSNPRKGRSSCSLRSCPARRSRSPFVSASCNCWLVHCIKAEQASRRNRPPSAGVARASRRCCSSAAPVVLRTSPGLTSRLGSPR